MIFRRGFSFFRSIKFVKDRKADFLINHKGQIKLHKMIVLKLMQLEIRRS